MSCPASLGRGRDRRRYDITVQLYSTCWNGEILSFCSISAPALFSLPISGEFKEYLRKVTPDDSTALEVMRLGMPIMQS